MANSRSQKGFQPQSSGLKGKEQAYTIRESRRAKHINIKVSNLGEVEVVIPVGFDRSKVPAIVEQKQGWIEKALQKVATVRQQSPEPQSTESLPAQITLRSPTETWTILYHQYSGRLQLMPLSSGPDGNCLLVQGLIDNQADCRKLLRQWLRHRAHHHLSALLQQLSQTTGLSYDKISVRGQKTRWGSCSSKKSISLNYKLLFLPKPLVRYVLIHELCHTVHMNHSPDFWSLVGEKEPDYKRLDKETNQGWQYVPTWVEQ